MDYSDLTIVIPTLNESGNIKVLLDRLTKSYSKARVLVSDDGSTDGTRKEVLAYARRNRNVRLIDRTNKKVHGLTASVLDAAMATGTPKIVVMDGDMQHPPEKVGQIADALDDYEICVGVRTAVKKWGIKRWVISKGAAYFSFIIFRLRGRPVCNDMMSGFFGIRTGIFKGVIRAHRNGFVEDGYKVMLDTLRLLNKKTRIGEVPYVTFHERVGGKSKFGFRHVVSTLKSTLDK